jgi:hypothetical protein
MAGHAAGIGLFGVEMHRPDEGGCGGIILGHYGELRSWAVDMGGDDTAKGTAGVGIDCDGIMKTG